MSTPLDTNTDANAGTSSAAPDGLRHNGDHGRPRAMPIGQVLRDVWDMLPQEVKDEFLRRDEEREVEDALRAQGRREVQRYELDVPDDFRPTISAPHVFEPEGLELVSMVEDASQTWEPPLLSTFNTDRVQEMAAFEIMARDLSERHVDPNAALMHAQYAEELLKERAVHASRSTDSSESDGGMAAETAHRSNK